jgi:hypothetical protein
MKKILLLTPIFIILFAGGYYASSFAPLGKDKKFTYHVNDNAEMLRLQSFSAEAESFVAANGYNTNFCFLLDMSLPSGQNRFFVYDLKGDSILSAGIVAHGSCN